MKNRFLPAILLFSGFASLTVLPLPAAAQGPAGVGATAATQDASHSINPVNWVHKDSKKSGDARTDLEKKLTPTLQSQGLLAANSNATEACASFPALDGCLAALHASHNLGLDFSCLRASVTGVHTADTSSCKIADTDKTQSLHKAIHEMKPDANAKQATKDAEQQAKDDLKAL